MFSEFNVLTLGLTIGSIILMILLKDRLNRIPFIALLVIVGIAINWTGIFESAKNLCADDIVIPSATNGDPIPLEIDCHFYVLKLENLQVPRFEELITLIPAALVLGAVIVFEQFLYLEEFERRGKRFGGGGDLGNIKT